MLLDNDLRVVLDICLASERCRHLSYAWLNTDMTEMRNVGRQMDPDARSVPGAEHGLRCFNGATLTPYQKLHTQGATGAQGASLIQAGPGVAGGRVAD